MKRLKFGLLLIIVLFLCTGCDGDVTRDIRHAGFTMGGTFECAKFYPVTKDDNSYDRIRYFLGTHLIDEDGKIYELSLSKKYYNEEHCMAADTSVHVYSILDNRVVRGLDGKYYYLTPQNNIDKYTPIPSTDNAYAVYHLLLKDNDVIKVVSAESNQGLFYVLKKDGNVYGYTVNTSDRNTPPKLVNMQLIYDKMDYGDAIIDFNYAGNSLNTFVRTEKKVFRMKMKNGDECTKYAGLDCQFEMTEDPIFEKYADRIVAYNGSVLITDYKKMFSVAS